MGKSMVLKDAGNCPRGYAVITDECILCRAQAAKPAQVVFLCADGAQHTCALAGCSEQRFDNIRGNVVGCCVVREDCVMLASDEASRNAYMTRRFLQERKKEENPPAALETEKAVSVKACGQDSKRAQDVTQLCFPQPRWPQPPCWPAARYEGGCWREACKKGEER